jgi:hypothetical protein
MLEETTPTIANTNLNTPNKTTTIVGSNLQANANNTNNAVNTDNTNNGQINIVVLFLMRGWGYIFTIKG